MEDQRRPGFTLVELLVTLAVIALLASVAAPAMGVFLDKARIRSAAQTLVQELRGARAYALSHAQAVHFSLHQSPGGHWCYGWRDATPCQCTADRPPSSCRTSGDDRLHSQDSIDFPAVQLITQRPSKNALQFSPIRGTATAATIELRNANARVRIILSPLGRVRTCTPTGMDHATC